MTRIAFPPSKPVRLAPARALAEGVALSTLYGMTITPADVARVLGRAKVRYVLVGAHAINLYTGKPRATQDVDVITGAPAKAGRALEQAYPNLTREDHPMVVRFKDGGREALDVIKAGSGKLFARVLRSATTVDMEGVSVHVLTYEAALAMKFYAMTSRARETDDRLQDAVDFSRAAKSRTRINRALLHELGELAYPGGGEALLKLLADARAGRRLDV
jgi:predicted nucleotidyltransferase